jgi:hypothetical protein
MRDALATMAPEVRASEVRLVGDGVEVFCQRRERFAHRKAWHACEEPVAQALRALLAGPYASLEAARAAGEPDYRLVADVRWDGATLRRIRSADDVANAHDDALLDPRAWLLLLLGAEGRMGQVCRSMWSDLHVEGNADDLVLDVPDTDRKRASWLLLADSQKAAAVFTLRVGYLAELERARREGTIKDYPLFPQDRLVRGRAKVDVREFVNDRTLNDWARDVERRLGLPRVTGEALYGWRRCFINLFDTWSTDARVKDLVTGHTDMRDPTFGSTRVTVYLNPQDLVYLREVQRLVEHVRTEFVRTGLPPSPARPVSSATDISGSRRTTR